MGELLQLAKPIYIVLTGIVRAVKRFPTPQELDLRLGYIPHLINLSVIGHNVSCHGMVKYGSHTRERCLGRWVWPGVNLNPADL